LARDDAHLLDILKAARLAIEFKGLTDKMAFLEDAVGYSAPASNCWRGGQADIARIPRGPSWKLVAGTRDKLIHFYDGVDLDQVWSMVISDLPKLIRLIEPLIPDAP
jgi:uncharacterized protein with HEPN domain